VKRYFMMLMALAFTGAAFATPSEASTNGAAVYVGRGSPERPVLVACPSGGVYVAWPDARNGSYDIFMQLMGEDGTPRWVSNGVAVCAARETQSVLSLAPDDVGGVLLAWQDSRAAAAAIYAQRVDSTGVSTWPQGGVPVCAFGGGSYNPSTISDGAGGMVIAWQDHRSGRGDIFAQRLDSGGQALWSADGIALCTASDEQYSPQAVTDGSGGAIVAWYDFRTGQSAVYAQRVDSSGHPLWASDGIAVWTGATISGMPSIASDGVGGAIIVWSDLRSGTYKAYAQRLDSSGGALWPVGGIALVTSAGQQEVTSVASDGAGGAVTVVQRFASGEYDVFASAISAAGTLRWSEDGVAVCDAPGYQLYPVICADRVGGALVVWSDSRIAGAPDIYAQELDNVGVPTWAEDGVRICAASGGQTYPAVARGASGTGFLAWIDLRLEGAPAFIYSQGVSPDGALVFPDSDLPKLMAVQDVPNDQGGRVFLRWLPCIFDVMELRVIAGYRVWRKIPLCQR